MKKNIVKNKTPELLAPAGNLEKLKYALEYGADAVYAGVPDFSLRVRINNFTLETLKEATEFCHERGKKIYVTINIHAHNQHLVNIPRYVQKLKKIGVDALIISDPGVIALAKKNWKEAEIHLSTQANCTNWMAAKFWADQGIQRIILGREVTLDEIKEIKKKLPKLELEYFVHGAMCMSYSGRCFLSKYFVNKSANLGDCVQPCRWEYSTMEHGTENMEQKETSQCSPSLNEREGRGGFYINEVKRPNQPLEMNEDRHGTYILNSKDLNLIKHLDKLIEAGVDSFKIEGRAKSIYYQGLVAGAYRKAIDAAHSKKYKVESRKLYKELDKKLVHRGYTTGFLLGEKADENTTLSHKKSDWEFCGTVVESKKLQDGRVKYKMLIKVHNQIRIGDQLEIVTPKYDIIKKKVIKIYNEDKLEYVESVHGGQKTIASLEINKKIPPMSLVRRKILRNK